MNDPLFPSFEVRSLFANSGLSIEIFISGCKLIYDYREDITSTDILAMKDHHLTDADFQIILEILDIYKLVDHKSRDYVILATEAEFQTGMGRIIEDLLEPMRERERISWAVEDKMVIIKDHGSVRFSVSIFFRWFEVLLYLFSKHLFVTKEQLLEQFSLMTESRNNYCIRILEQQELIANTPLGIFLTELLYDAEEWLENMKADIRAGYDFGS